MLYVKKRNRVYRINEGDKTRYLREGFAVIDAKTGKVLEKTGTKTENKLEKLADENKKLKAELKAFKSKNADSKAETTDKDKK